MISGKIYALFTFVLMLFVVIGSVSADDSVNGCEDIVTFSQDLEVSTGSIMEAPYHDDVLCDSSRQTFLSGNDTQLYYGNGTSFKVSLSDGEGHPLANQNIVFSLNNVNYTRTTNGNGVASIAINLISGNYSVSSFYKCNGIYDSSYTTNQVNVLSTVGGEDIVKYYKNDTQYYATFFDGQGELLDNSEITFNINGVFYHRKTNENGVAKLNINLLPGQYILTAINAINGEMHSNTINVLPTISSDDLAMQHRDGHKFTVNILDDDGEVLPESEVTFNINGVLYTRITDANGYARLNINLDVGEYIITSTNYKGLSVSNKISISKSDSIIKAGNAHAITGLDRDYTVQLCGSNNVTVPFAPIKFRYSDIVTTSVTDENGEATFHISNHSVGRYSIEYGFEGNLNYKAFKSSSIITVEDSTSILAGKDLKMVYKDGSVFDVTLTDKRSVPIANESITFAINGNSYHRNTDEKGVARLSINLNPGTYEISYSYSDVDDVAYNVGSNSIVVSKILAYWVADDLVFDYGNRGVFSTILTDGDKNPLEAIGVTFTIGGMSYVRTTDSNGVARLNINQPVGYYEITMSLDNAFYTAGSKTNHVLVNGTILIGEDLYSVEGFTRDYSVTLLDAYRNPIPNAVIEFTCNGISKRATTNAQGIAKIAVGGLHEGSYPIIYEYVKDKNAGQSNVRVTNSVLNFKNTISNLSPYLSSTKNCPVSNAEIVALANQLTGGLTNPLDKAMAIFDYVRDAISYSYYYDTYYGAVGTLHSKRGNCVDQSHLSIALYRAAGLPARYVHGNCVFRDGDVGGHVWTQVLVGDTWIVSDTINVRNSLGEVINWNNYNYNLKGYYSSLPF